MNLQRVMDGRGGIRHVRLRCVCCGNYKQIGAMFADLDGEPYKTYFCSWCATSNQLLTPDQEAEIRRNV